MNARRNRISSYAHALPLPATGSVAPQPVDDVSNIGAGAATLSLMPNPAEPRPPDAPAAPEPALTLASGVGVTAGDDAANSAAISAAGSIDTGTQADDAANAQDAPNSGSAADPLTGLTAAVRILPPHRERDRTLLIALALVLLAHVGFVAGTLYRPAAPAGETAREQERRGQVDVSETITVELVEEPDAASKSKQSQIGEDAPPAEQSPPQPTPPAPPAEGEKAEQQPPEEPKPVEREKPVEEAKKAAQPKRAPPPPDAAPELSLEDFDTTMDEYAAAVERAQAERRRRTDPRTAEAQRIKGAAAQGTQSAYSKSVTTALARNKPKGYLTRGGVYVQFELTMTGALRYVRVVQSSGDPLLDQTGVDAVKKTPFPAPPADVDPRDLRYTIHYVFN